MTTMDSSELDLLRSTAREAFTKNASLSELGELGLLGLLTPESSGGSGWQVQAAATVAIEAGRALSPTPWTGGLLAAAALSFGSLSFESLSLESPSLDERSDDVVGQLLDGTAVGAFAVRVGERPDGYLLPGTAEPTVVVVAERHGPIVAFRADDPGVSVVAQGDGALDSSRGAVRVSVAGAAGRDLAVAASAGLADAAVLLACADTLGALAVTSALVTDYLCGREAFGQPLASFQALQHRLADLAVLVAEGEALVKAAATGLEDHGPRASALVDHAHTFLAQRCTAALDDCVQLSGGMGVTWEWPVHHAMRRAMANAAVQVPAVPSAHDLRESLDAEDSTPPTGYRAYVRTVIAEGGPPMLREGHRAPTSADEEAALRAWYRRLYETGLLGASWPPEWGGSPDHEPANQLVVTEELIRARAPRPVDQVMLASHLLLHFGTPEQKQRYLPRIRSVDDVWCQLFSEPGAGSDLAGITTKARQRDDGAWVMAGQKTWTTDGHWAQLGLALVRTSDEAKRHAGLTVFIVPMDSAGIEVQPIRLMSGAHDINTVFLDDVVLGPDQVLGEVGQGWSVCMSGLEVERFGVGGNVILLEQLLRDLITVAEAVSSGGEPLIEDRAVRVSINDLLAEVEAARAFVSGQIRRMQDGQEQVADASISKLIYTESYNRIARRGVELVQTYGPVPPAAEEAAGRLQDAWFWSRVLTISGGSSEVMRNVIAKRRLRLPSAS